MKGYRRGQRSLKLHTKINSLVKKRAKDPKRDLTKGDTPMAGKWRQRAARLAHARAGAAQCGLQSSRRLTAGGTHPRSPCGAFSHNYTHSKAQQPCSSVLTQRSRTLCQHTHCTQAFTRSFIQVPNLKAAKITPGSFKRNGIWSDQ